MSNIITSNVTNNKIAFVYGVRENYTYKYGDYSWVDFQWLDENGTPVTKVDAGTYRLKATARETATWAGATQTITVTVLPRPIKADTTDVTTTAIAYDGGQKLACKGDVGTRIRFDCGNIVREPLERNVSGENGVHVPFLIDERSAVSGHGISAAAFIEIRLAPRRFAVF